MVVKFVLGPKICHVLRYYLIFYRVFTLILLLKLLHCVEINFVCYCRHKASNLVYTKLHNVQLGTCF